MAYHWNFQSQADSYVQKFWGILFFPVLMSVMYLLLQLTPRFDPLKKNIEHFRKYYDGFAVVFMGFFFYIYMLVLARNLNIRFSFGKMLIPAFGFLLFYIGILMEKSKRNWFIGIKTPWTLSSDKVWDKTHKLGGRLFKIGAILIITIGLFYQDSFLIFLILGILFFIVILTTIYSYLQFKKHKRIRQL